MPTEERIRTFDTIFKSFRKRLEISENHSKWAAIYFVLLIETFPANLATVLKRANDENYDIKRRSLEIGREILLQNGFIAHAYSSNVGSDFDNESFLPVNPMILWEENKDKIAEEDRVFRDGKANELGKIYLEKFKTHGCIGTVGDITVRYSSQWFTYAIINNLFYKKGNRGMDIMLSSLGSFDSPYRDFYGSKLLLEQKLKIRALYDPYSYTYDKINEENFERRLVNARTFMEKYGDIVEIRRPNVTHATTRRVIFDNIAIDSMKLLPLNREEPSYVGTIYLNTEDIGFLRENFNVAWNNSLDIGKMNAHFPKVLQS